MKKTFIAILFLLNTFFVFGQEKMNIIFFLVDDFGSTDLACYGSKFYETPNIDGLAAEGIKFTNAYTAHPRCVPSRYGMMTGRFPARDQVPGGKVHFKENLPTIAEALKENGYKTFYTGKWHLGHTEPDWPHNQGFDVNKGGCAAGAPGSYFFPYNKVKKESKGHKTADPIIGLDGVEKGTYITDHITDETIKFITENKNNTFFATVAHYAVHTPLEAKKELIEKYKKKLETMTFEGEEYTFGVDGRHKERQDEVVYAAMIESVDISLGRIIQSLKDNGLYEKTVIVLTSDHGGLSNSGTDNQRPLATTNLPWRAGKGHLYEGGIRVPMIAYVPGMTKKGTTNNSVITGTDYYPTFLELAGGELKPNVHVDGVSFVSALKGKTINEDRDFFWHSPLARPKSTGDNNCSVYRKGDYKLFQYFDSGAYELYNLKSDPYETKNLIDSKKKVASEMTEKLIAWKKEVNAFDKANEPKKQKNNKQKKGKQKNKKTSSSNATAQEASNYIAEKMELSQTDIEFITEALTQKLSANKEAKSNTEEEKKEIYRANQKVLMKTLIDKFGKEKANKINECFKEFRKNK